MNYKEHLKKKDWIYYSTLFFVFAAIDFVLNFFAFDTLLRQSIIKAVVGGAFFVALWALLDHMGKDVDTAIEEDKRIMNKNK